MGKSSCIEAWVTSFCLQDGRFVQFSKVPNSLINQPSPYLQGMSNQPVDWWPWSMEALQKARELDKPVLVSIGYASCHWCRRMERENYEDSYVASIMNRHFVCIKVDREERPDLDLVYLEAARMFNQSAGWPLHAFCLPDGSPFWCGTFFPKDENEHGIAPWPQVLMRIAQHYLKAKHELMENGRNALANLAHTNNLHLSDARDWKADLLWEAGKALTESHDDEMGGFTPAPKFPSPMKMEFLFTLGESKEMRKKTGFTDRMDECLKRTLEAMSQGGLCDHLNGGFFRYCLDRQWQSPHFEKMLSDNALLVSVFSRGLRKYKESGYREAIEGTLAWIESNLGCVDSGFGSSISAEHNGVEGGYYLWSLPELSEALGQDDAEKITSRWLPLVTSPELVFLPQLFSELNFPARRKEQIFAKLRNYRIHQKPPAIDELRTCSSNALLARAYLDAGIALGNNSLIAKSRKLLQWMSGNFHHSDGSIGSILYPNGSLSPHAFLDDYALWAEALLSLAGVVEALGVESCQPLLDEAENLLAGVVKNFRDEKVPGFFLSSENMSNPGPLRKKSWYDHASPCGNSSLLRCFHLLGLLGKEKNLWKREFNEALAAYPKIIRQSPDAVGHALGAIAEATNGVALVGGPQEFLHMIIEKMREKPYRPVFLHRAKEFSISVKGKKINCPSNKMDDLIEKALG